MARRILPDDRDKIKQLFFAKGFKLENEEYLVSFGDSLLQFANGNLQVRVLSDRGIEYLEVSTLDKPGSWYDLGLLKALMLDSDLLLAHPSIEADLIFLFDRLEEILRMFEPISLEHTKTMLDELKALRAHQMFPDWY
jgi:hypothetical protein